MEKVVQSDTCSRGQVAHRMEAHHIEKFNVLGPTVEYLKPVKEGEPCFMRGTIPPGVSVPLHSHADPETFYMISGKIDGLSHSDGGFRWVPIRPGDIFHVPGGAKHAFRNRTKKPAMMIIVSTDKIGRFFQEVGSPVVPGRRPEPPTVEMIQQFLETSERYGHWNATPEENAAIGISLPVRPKQ